MTPRQKRARLATIRRMVEGPSEPDPAVLDTYQASDEDALEMAQKPNAEVGGRWVAEARGQIDHSSHRK